MKRILTVLLLAAMLLTVVVPALAAYGDNAYHSFRLCIYDANDKYIGEFANNNVYLGDLSSSMHIYPAVRITNWGNEPVQPNISMTVDRHDYNWKTAVVDPGCFTNFRITSDNRTFMSSGKHNYTYMLGRRKAASKVYNVYAGTSARTNDAPNFLDINRISWDQDGSNLKCRFLMENNSPYKTVESVKLYVYCTDHYGNNLYGDSVYYDTFSVSIAPGESDYSGYLYVPQYASINNVYCGVQEIRYSDGSSFIDPKDGGRNYSEFTLSK